jgi:hypothetical protein
MRTLSRLLRDIRASGVGSTVPGAWLAQLAGSALRSVKRCTVREALEAYLADLRRHGRPTPHVKPKGASRVRDYDRMQTCSSTRLAPER